MLGRVFIAIEAVLVVGFAATLAAMRAGAIGVHPAILTSICALLLVTLIAHAVTAERIAVKFLLAGLVLVFGGGLANWLFSLQGYVILTERDAVPLAATSHLQAFDAGPLSNPNELAAMLQLEACELRPASDGFYPESRLRLLAVKQRDAFLVTPSKGASRGTLRFHQGAFGFAPRIVITRNDRTIFDRIVPFTTGEPSRGVLTFDGAFRTQGILVRAAIDASTLDERMKGHVKLGVDVSRDGRLLGRGELFPGHFADLADGYRIGFVGLKKWSEVDVSRRNYAEPMFAGALLALAGAGASLFRRRA